MEIISRKEAKERGLKFYFTGKPCKNGHLCEKKVEDYRCVECTKETDKRGYENNKAQRLKKNKDYYSKNKDKIQSQKRKYAEENDELLKEKRQRKYEEDKYILEHEPNSKRAEELKERRAKQKEYRNRPEVKEARRIYDQNRDPEYIKAKGERYRENNKEKIKAANKRWQEENRGYTRDYYRDRYHNNKEFKASSLMRGYLKHALKLARKGKTDTTSQMLGYTAQDLVDDMESKMSEGMTWDNHGDWHIDHKIPVAVFVRDGVDCATTINNLDNLVPMWADHNINKSDKTLEEWLAEKGEDSEEYKLYSRFL